MPIQLKTIHKEISEVLEIFGTMKDKNDFMRGIKKLLALKERIEVELEKKEKSSEKYARKVKHLIGWYKKIWNNKPPEYFIFTSDPDAALSKHFKELLQIYERHGEDVEQLKRDYENFLRSRKDGEKKGIVHFRKILWQLKLKQNSSTKSWTTPENQRGLDYYLKEIPFDDEGQLPF